MKSIFYLFFFLISFAHGGYPEGFQAFNEGDYETAYKEYSIEAENGNSYAQADLGDMYYHGVGVDRITKRLSSGSSLQQNSLILVLNIT